jgi:hypothetical protein
VLLEPLTYVERALAPTADLLRSDAASASEAVGGLIDRGASIVVLTETGTLPPETSERLVRWVESGGTLLRFASPSLAATTVDALLPVRLRQGERALGGSLSWQEPQPVGAFPPAGPFAHIPVPPDVRVERQVLADPEALRDAQVWAELRDGTPLVTAAARGTGRIVLFHVTADPRWSNLPLSGAFVDMLGAIVQTAGTVAPPAESQPAADAQPTAAPWQPVQVLDGLAIWATPTRAQPSWQTSLTARPSAQTPPGIYDREGTCSPSTPWTRKRRSLPWSPARSAGRAAAPRSSRAPPTRSGRGCWPRRRFSPRWTASPCWRFPAASAGRWPRRQA